MNQNEFTPAVVTDINIPFGRLVVIILKLMLASIPALILFNALKFFVVLALVRTGIWPESPM